MKKLSISLCFMFLCIALFNSRVHAAYVYNVNYFEQDNGSGNVLADELNGSTTHGPGSSGNYDIYSDAALTESGGVLELDSANGGGPLGERYIYVDVENSDYFYTSGVLGTLDADFNYSSSSLQNESYFGLDVFNMASNLNDADVEDWAEIAVVTNANGVFAVWGDETTGFGQAEINLGDDLVSDGSLIFTHVELAMDINANKTVTGNWEFYNGGTQVYTHTESEFTSLAFGTSSGLGNDIYTGGIYTGEPASGAAPVPEPTTVALLGIGLVGLAGTEARRRRKKRAVDNS